MVAFYFSINEADFFVNVGVSIIFQPDQNKLHGSITMQLLNHYILLGELSTLVPLDPLGIDQ